MKTTIKTLAILIIALLSTPQTIAQCSDPPAQPTGLACYEMAIFNSDASVCAWEIIGTAPIIDDGCDQTIDTFDESICSVVHFSACPYSTILDYINCKCVVVGCTDPCAINYNPSANLDDGSCESYDMICNDDCTQESFGGNWDASTCSCVNTTEPINGCTDPTACNFSLNANCDDNSCFFDCPLTNNCHIDDWTALKALYISTNGNDWTNNRGWIEQIANQSSPSANCNLGDLYGVELNDEGRVMELTLLDNQLKGVIPFELSYMSKIVFLSLPYNNLSGNIPLEFGNLTNLSVLILIGNNLSGNIPKELGRLSNLKFLNLTANMLSGNIPSELGNLSNLETLRIGSNELTGSIPLQFGSLSNLKYLLLFGNQLSGGIPSELGNLSNLVDLYLSSNQLIGSIPSELGNLSNLEELSLFKNQLSGTVTPELCNLNNLNSLALYSNNLSGCYPECFNIFCEIAVNSDISNGNNFNAPFEYFCEQGVDVCLTLPYCHINDWTALKALYESTNGDNWKRNNGWEQISGQAPLDDCDLSDMYGLKLNDNGRVVEINLYNNKLNGVLPPEMVSLTELTALYLSSVDLQGEIPSEIAQLSQLEYLFLIASNISGSIPAALGQLKNLKDLRLSYNQLDGPIPLALTTLPNLSYLSLSNNQLSGAIPAELANLNLRRLSLSNNQLTGSIPAGLSTLTRLRLLTLDNNELSGCYPADLTSLCNQLIYNFFGEEDDISSGNNLDATWEDFCNGGAGDCSNLRLGDLNNFAVYPNPTNGQVMVQFDNVQEQARSIHVYNVAGKKVQSELVTSGKQTKLNLQDLPKGIYIVEVSNGYLSNTQKLILQ